jgi:integrase/recombinase XerD
MTELGERRNKGGVHQAWGAIKTFLRWWITETEIDGWKNPIIGVVPPPKNRAPLPGIPEGDYKKLLSVCGRDLYGQRDRAVMTFLYDTGLRVSEACAVRMKDLNFDTGAVWVANGKGDKSRTAFVGAVGLREITKYLRKLPATPKPDDPLFFRKGGGFLRREGMDNIILRAAKRAGVPLYTPHDFRRAFTIQSLRNGADVLSISRLLGHADISLVQLYANQLEDDLKNIHDKTSPADNI